MGSLQSLAGNWPWVVALLNHWAGGGHPLQEGEGAGGFWGRGGRGFWAREIGTICPFGVFPLFYSICGPNSRPIHVERPIVVL